MPTTFTWDAAHAGSTADWTTPANWDQNSSYPGNTGDEDAIVIIPSGMERCYVNADLTIGELTVSGNHNGGSAGTWDVKQQNTLTVTGNMYMHSGTWDCGGNNLNVGTNFGQLAIKDGHLLPGNGTHRWGSGMTGDVFALDLSDANGTGVITSGAGVWHVGSIRCNRANYELNLPSEVCYVNGEMNSWDRKFELTNGKILHNKGALHLYGPDDLEPANPGQTTLTNANIAIQWDATTVAAANGNQGPYDLIIDIPYDNRPTPIGAQHTINLRNKLVVEHYMYMYKGKFTNWSADVSAAKDLVVSGMVLFGCCDNGLINSANSIWQGRPGFASSPYSGSRNYNRWSRGYMLLTGASAMIHLGSGVKGNTGESDKNRDGTNNSQFASVNQQGAAVLDLGDTNTVIGYMKSHYQDTNGGVGGGQNHNYPYLRFSSNNTTFNSKGYSSYSVIYTNMGTYLGNKNNAFTLNSGNVGYYHNNGLVTYDAIDNDAIINNNQNAYISVCKAGDPALDESQDGYGRRITFNNLTVTGMTMQLDSYGYSGGPLVVLNDLIISSGSTIEYRSRSNTDSQRPQPYAGGIIVSGGTYVSGTLDFSDTSHERWQAMVVSSSSYGQSTYEGAWSQYKFNDMYIDPNGVFIAPGTGDTLDYTNNRDAVVEFTGGGNTIGAGRTIYWDGTFTHNSGSVQFSDGSPEIEQKLNDFYSVSGGTVQMEWKTSPTYIKGSLQGSRSFNNGYPWNTYISKDFHLISGASSYGWSAAGWTDNIFISGNFIMDAGAKLGSHGASYPAGFSGSIEVHGNFINNGGEIY